MIIGFTIQSTNVRSTRRTGGTSFSRLFSVSFGYLFRCVCHGRQRCSSQYRRYYGPNAIFFSSRRVRLSQSDWSLSIYLDGKSFPNVLRSFATASHRRDKVLLRVVICLRSKAREGKKRRMPKQSVYLLSNSCPSRVWSWSRCLAMQAPRRLSRGDLSQLKTRRSRGDLRAAVYEGRASARFSTCRRPMVDDGFVDAR